MRPGVWLPILVMVAAMGMLGVSSAQAQAPDINLTGNWTCGEGTYYIRQIGTKVWWLGMPTDGGKEWTNVFRGEIKGRHIIGEWADVPRGEIMGSGTLHLEMHLRDGRVVELRKTRQIGDNFGGEVWRR